MDYETRSISNVIELGKQYVENQLEYAELKAVSKGGKIISNVITEISVVVAAILAFLFASVTLGFWLSDMFGSYTKGFGSVSILYIVLAIIVTLTKDKYIEKFLINRIIKKYNDGKDKNNN